MVRALPDGTGPADAVFNLACPASPAMYQADPVFPWRRSLSGIDNLLGFARARYDEGKRAAEVLIHDMIRMHGIDTMIARIFNT